MVIRQTLAFTNFQKEGRRDRGCMTNNPLQLQICSLCNSHAYIPPRWPSGKASTSRAEDPGSESRMRRDFFRGRVIPVTQKLALQWLPCQAPGVIGSVLGLVGPVSVYCDWVR